MAREREESKEAVKRVESQAARDFEQLTKEEDERARLNAARTIEKFTTKQSDDE